MKTYKITFIMDAPLAFVTPPLFDGIMAYAYVREKMGSKFVQTLNIDKDDKMLDFEDLPIQRHEKGYFLASRMFWDEKRAVPHIQRWRKRWASKHDRIADFGKGKRKVGVGSGEYKSYDMPLTCITIDKVWFYFRSEKLEEVKYLLEKWVNFIGKKRAQGYGYFDRFEIEECNYDFPLGSRPIPARFVDMRNVSGTVKYCSWKPPYWLPENFEECFC